MLENFTKIIIKLLNCGENSKNNIEHYAVRSKMVGFSILENQLMLKNEALQIVRKKKSSNQYKIGWKYCKNRL